MPFPPAQPAGRKAVQGHFFPFLVNLYEYDMYDTIVCDNAKIFHALYGTSSCRENASLLRLCACVRAHT